MTFINGPTQSVLCLFRPPRRLGIMRSTNLHLQEWDVFALFLLFSKIERVKECRLKWARLKKKTSGWPLQQLGEIISKWAFLFSCISVFTRYFLYIGFVFAVHQNVSSIVWKSADWNEQDERLVWPTQWFISRKIDQKKVVS